MRGIELFIAMLSSMGCSTVARDHEEPAAITAMPNVGDVGPTSQELDVRVAAERARFESYYSLANTLTRRVRGSSAIVRVEITGSLTSYDAINQITLTRFHAHIVQTMAVVAGYTPLLEDIEVPGGEMDGESFVYPHSARISVGRQYILLKGAPVDPVWREIDELAVVNIVGAQYEYGRSLVMNEIEFQTIIAQLGAGEELP